MDGFIGTEREIPWKKEQDTSWRKKPECNRSKRKKRADYARKQQEKNLLEKKAKRRKLFLDLAQKAWYNTRTNWNFSSRLHLREKR